MDTKKGNETLASIDTAIANGQRSLAWELIHTYEACSGLSTPTVRTILASRIEQASRMQEMNQGIVQELSR